MTNNRRIYRHTLKSLKQLYPQKLLNGHQLRHLNTLATMICGIIQGKNCQLAHIALKIPSQTAIESKVKKMSRLMKHQSIDAETFFLPFIQPLLTTLANSGLVTLAIDGSATGRKCMTLMVSVIYRKRAIPIAWLTVKGNKGHLPESIHLKLLSKVSEIMPNHAHVVLLGDGEFDGIALQKAISKIGWQYVLRTAKSTIINDAGDKFALKEIGLIQGSFIELPQIGFTRENYGPVTAIAWWDKDYDEPIYLVTNVECSADACSLYRRRFRIETFFSDQKSRGFNLQKSHLSSPKRVERFLIAACLAYIWMIYLGTSVKNDPDVMRQIHRADRCDLSLFQIGLRYVDHLLNLDKDVPISCIPH
jgi:hypothetical protein